MISTLWRSSVSLSVSRLGFYTFDSEVMYNVRNSTSDVELHLLRFCRFELVEDAVVN